MTAKLVLNHCESFEYELCVFADLRGIDLDIMFHDTAEIRDRVFLYFAHICGSVCEIILLNGMHVNYGLHDRLINYERAKIRVRLGLGR